MRWIIVAHPDDEIIFAGGAILSHSHEPWTVVIAAAAADSARAAESLKAREELRALGVEIDYRFLGHDDIQFHPTGGVDPVRLDAELKALGVSEHERVYTHGAPGEYGHNAHKAVHRCVAEALGRLASVSVFSGGGEPVECIVEPDRLGGKILLFSRVYRSQQAVWTGIARVMLDVTHREPHFALSPADHPAEPPDRLPVIPSGPDQGALASALREEIGRAAGARDALVIGLSGAVELQQLRAKVTGRIDVVDVSPDARAIVDRCAGARLVAGDFFGWEAGDGAYDLILWIGSLQHVRDFAAAFEQAARRLRPEGRFILTHEPLIEGHPRQGEVRLKDEPVVYRRPTQAVLDLARRHGMRVRMVKDLVVEPSAGEPVIRQLVHLQLR